jgi:hypothetical protein
MKDERREEIDKRARDEIDEIWKDRREKVKEGE